MAIYHFSVKTVSRSKGQSAVASAAYRSGNCLKDERNGKTHDYTRRQGVEGTFIVAPAGCEWTQDRGTLWNSAEGAEKRKNSTVAREYELALPAELNDLERKKLARQFAEALAERYGVAADVALHSPGREGDQRNHHAHILTTTRKIMPDGLGEKTRVLDAAKTGSVEIEGLRSLWAEQCNAALERAGQTVRVDHRSYERQGAEKVPSVHLGPHSMAVERRAERQARQEGLTYEPRTYRARANAKAAEKNRLADTLRQIIKGAEEVIARAQKTADDLLGWFGSLAEQVGQEIIEQKKERGKHGQGSAEQERIEKNIRFRRDDEGSSRGFDSSRPRGRKR